MKQLFRCEYCAKTGTAEEIQKHEEECTFNYNKKSCFTCKHKESSFLKITCSVGKEVPSGSYIEKCPNYEWDEKDHSKMSFTNLFGGAI